MFECDIDKQPALKAQMNTELKGQRAVSRQ